MTKAFKIGDRVSWNSEAGRVSGTIIRVHMRDVEHKGHHANPDVPQYEVKRAKTDHIAFHKGFFAGVVPRAVIAPSSSTC